MAHLLLLCLLPLAHHALAVPTPTAFLLPRNNVAPPANFTSVSDIPTAAAQSTSAFASSATLTASAGSSNSTDLSGNLFGGVPSQLLEWVAIVIAVAVAISLLTARYLYIRRFGRVTMRSYFLPPTGFHFLGLHIKGPPPRPVRAGWRPPARRARRDRTTTGPAIGEGGRRDASGDAEGDQHELPAYTLDPDLPTYDIITPSVFSPLPGSLDPSSSSPAPAHPDAEPMSVQQYEEQTRRAAAAALPVAAPPPAHLLPNSPTSARGVARVPVPAWEGDAETASMGTSSGSTLADHHGGLKKDEEDETVKGEEEEHSEQGRRQSGEMAERKEEP